MRLSEPRYVFDTNVLISALLFARSIPAQAFTNAQEHGKILVSLPLLTELQNALDRPTFETYVTPAERNQFLTALTREATLVTVAVELYVTATPKDDLVLELAGSGGATTIVKGDSDLLALRVYDSIPIMSPADFLRQATPWSRVGYIEILPVAQVTI